MGNAACQRPAVRAAGTGSRPPPLADAPRLRSPAAARRQGLPPGRHHRCGDRPGDRGVENAQPCGRRRAQSRQPIPFSHKHHVGDVGIDCRYCHTTVETAARSPACRRRSVCLSCHSQLFADAPLLAPLHRSEAQRPADRLEARAQAARLRLLRPQHPRRQGRRLRRVPRPRRPDAADWRARRCRCTGASTATAIRAAPAAARRRCSTMTPTARRGARRSARADLQSTRAPDRLLDLPSLSGACAMSSSRCAIERTIPVRSRPARPTLQA